MVTPKAWLYFSTSPNCFYFLTKLFATSYSTIIQLSLHVNGETPALGFDGDFQSVVISWNVAYCE